ncbi:TolC family protein [Elizabethkingia sp. JS20170427COW]|uniref:TolC family protein n=1 Tax=Elizabethkingia sp. JS20170427COW TaxID=2583851 RepID=UPI0011100A69|nr:TolC family protein [Elizabethkingia sp. JS20170427COW]QCX54034.1 TolC family protein [Elizabethkingia sp. JS20170427COW]
MKKINNLWILTGIASLLVVSCKVTDTYERPEIPQEKLSQLYGDQTSSDTLSTAQVSWDKIFTDEKLQTIIRRTIENNYDLKTAVLRIQQSDAYFKQSQLAFLPSVSAGPTAGVSKSSRAAQISDLMPVRTMQSYQLTATTGWEIDIWGKLASAKRAAYASLLASDASKRVIQTQLVSQAAILYYQLLAYDKQLEITQKTVELRRKQLETIKALKEAAILTGADVVQSEANLYAAEVSIPDLELSIKQTQNSLALLMGVSTTEIDRNTMDNQVVYSDLKTGVPSQILKNRPDVQLAEYNFQQAFENYNVAKADVYPSFNITATLGLSSLKLKNLFDHSFMYSASGALSQVIFGKGAKKTQVKVTDLEKQAAYIAYENSIVTAGNEVSNALYSYQAALKKEETRKLQIETLTKAVDFNMELLKYTSKTNYTDVLTSEQNLLSAQLSGVNDKLQQLVASANFYRAIGGGQF